MKTCCYRLLIIEMALVLSGGTGCLIFFGDDSTSCLDNLDCPLGDVCDPQEKICRPGQTNKPLSVVDVELIPVDESQAALTQLAGLDLRLVDAGQLRMELDRPIKISGVLASPDAPGGVPGVLVAYRDPLFDERTVTYSINVGEDGSYQAWLSPGSYRFLFKPTDRKLFPQLQVRQLKIDGNNQPVFSYEKFADPKKDNLAEQKTLLVVCGKLMEQQGMNQPARGYLVEASGPDGLRSNLAQPEENGDFCLRLGIEKVLKTDGDFQLQVPSSITISAVPDSPQSHLPSLYWENVEVKEYHLGTFFTGKTPQMAALSGRVSVKGKGPLAGCEIRLEVRTSNNGQYSVQLQSDDQGRFFTTLPAGKVRLTAVPSPAVDAGVARFEYQLTDKADIDIELQPKLSLVGKVVDPDDSARGEVIVKARRISSVSGEDDGIYSIFETMSESDGSFTLAVDEGRYLLTMYPPAASGLPQSLPRVIYVTSDTQVDVRITRLPPATLVKGMLVGPDEQPACGAQVRFFYSPESGSALLLGQTVTDNAITSCTGQFSLLLPAQVE